MNRLDTDRRDENTAISTQKGRGQKPYTQAEKVSKLTATREYSRAEVTEGLMEQIVSRENMMAAHHRVVSNKGSAGIDEMSVDALMAYLKENWAAIKEDLLKGRYEPMPVRKVEIPKPGGRGMRILGIPTVLDRLIQQAVHQILMPVFDPDFSESSFGFRPGRSAQQAVLSAHRYVVSGRKWVVDMDLEKFFDRVNHDVLMARVGRKVRDKRVLCLIGKYLRAGLMSGGIVTARKQGTPQGGPLSPLLSNILLDDFDKELERRGHKFCRYADDCNIYVHSQRAGERVLASLTMYLAKRLKLSVNEEKSAVDLPSKRTFLGYSMTRERSVRLKAAPHSAKRLQGKLREIFRKGKGRSIVKIIEEITPILRGWITYLRYAGTKRVFQELDQWIRHKLRVVIWRQWKRARTRAQRLMRRGVSEVLACKAAYSGKGPWVSAMERSMNIAFNNAYFRKLGLIPVTETLYNLQNNS
jgi:RNA-directed DNA polymerase